MNLRTQLSIHFKSGEKLKFIALTDTEEYKLAAFYAAIKNDNGLIKEYEKNCFKWHAEDESNEKEYLIFWANVEYISYLPKTVE